jgi:hypothetical protein
MPRATAWRENATLVQLSSDSAHASEPLGSQVIHNGPQVRRTVLRVRLDCSDGLLVAHLLSCNSTDAGEPLDLQVIHDDLRSP